MLMSRVILVSGWRGVKRLRDRIVLDEVELASRVTHSDKANLVLCMEDGEERTLHVTAPGIWRMQIDYRLRRIAAVGAEEAEPAQLSEAMRSQLATADQLEEVASEYPEDPHESLDEVFFGTELAGLSGFETDLRPGIGIEPEPDEVTVGEVEVDLEVDADVDVDELDLSPEIVEEAPALVSRLAFDAPLAEAGDPDASRASADEEPEAHVELGLVVEPAGAEELTGVPVPDRRPSEPLDRPGRREVDPESLLPIGDDVVLDQAMDASTHESVVIDWLEQEEADRPEASVEAHPEVVSRSFLVREVYQASGERPETAGTESPAREPALNILRAPIGGSMETIPVAPSSEDTAVPDLDEPISLDPPAPRPRRRPIQSLADLRPMSLADLIQESEPIWTPLAEID